MSGHITLQCLPVSEFFARINWQGLEIVPTQSTSKVKIGSPKIASSRRPNLTSPQALCLTVGEFFGACNWQGEIIRDYKDFDDTGAIEEVALEETIEFSPTLPVRDFFALVAWDGQPKLSSSVPSISIEPPKPKPEAAKIEPPANNTVLPPVEDTGMNLNDLSNLF